MGRDVRSERLHPGACLHGKTIFVRTGFCAHVVRPTGGAPFLRVTNPAALRSTERVHCERDMDGAWSYAWTWRTPIAPAGDLPEAAAKVTRVLGTVGA